MIIELKHTRLNMRLNLEVGLTNNSNDAVDDDSIVDGS